MGTIGFSPGCCGCAAPTCGITVCIKDCTGAAVGGATIGVTTTGGGAVTSGTTDSITGCATSVNVGTAGTYRFQISKTGFRTVTRTQAVTCGGTYTFHILKTTDGCSTLNIFGCCGYTDPAGSLPGATVTVDGGTYTQPGRFAGGVCLPIADPGSYPYTATYLSPDGSSRYNVYSGTLTIGTLCTPAAQVDISLTPAGGYVCPPWAGSTCSPTTCGPDTFDPIPTTLTLIDSVYGTCALTYSATDCKWHGSLSASFPGGCARLPNPVCGIACPPKTVTVQYQFPVSGTIIYPTVKSYPATATGCPDPAGAFTGVGPAPCGSYTYNATVPLISSSACSGCESPNAISTSQCQKFYMNTSDSNTLTVHE